MVLRHQTAPVLHLEDPPATAAQGRAERTNRHSGKNACTISIQDGSSNVPAAMDAIPGTASSIRLMSIRSGGSNIDQRRSRLDFVRNAPIFVQRLVG